MKKLLIVFILGIFFSCQDKKDQKVSSTSEEKRKPNIVLFYVDDLGYGDVGCYGATAVKTPNIDKLAANGIKFTDAHSAAATCTPSRYSLLTGNYAFRNDAKILPGDAPLLIDTSKITMPKMLQNAGYATAVVGKWHLGLGIGQVDWNQKITPGANEVGFDYSYLIPATGDRVPTIFVENGKAVNLSTDDPLTISYDHIIGNRPTGLQHPELLKYKADRQHSKTIVNGISRIGYMAGGKSAEWVDEEIPFVLTDQAKGFINRNKENPFFLYYSFHDIHVPRAPNQKFQGKTDLGPRGDAIVQMDYVVGEIVKQLEQLSLLEETIIIFTSDNGPILDDGYFDKAEELIGDHKPSGPFRGAKYSIYEAGTRMPTILSWKANVEPAESKALLNQVDLYASIASLVDQDIPEYIIDSENHLDAWLGKTQKGREEMIEEGFTLALRDGQWKYIQPFTTQNKPAWMANKNIESGLMSKAQLFNLENDISEENNLAENNPDLVEKMEESLQMLIDKSQDK